ncbi:RICIN domain-containing protein [Kitasatospora sp. NPDC056446]|uniref:RICIN domain-containing protein n=1 Tax=Kitasatospora sp. NPDC056446 TaxID=3345819 RepID=UPI0036C80925
MPRTRLSRARAAAAVVGTAVTLLTALPAAPASAEAGGIIIFPATTTVVNAHSGKCLEIADWSWDNGAPARQWDCTGGANQQWSLVALSPGYALVNRFSGKCLEIADWRTDDGAPARQWNCTGGANQNWVYRGDIGPSNEMGLSNFNSGKFLEIADWGTDNGAPARQWTASFPNYDGNKLWITAIRRG